MRKAYFQVLVMISFLFLAASIAAAHCEIPCGIYDDDLRIKMIAEHITTIEKSMKQISELQGNEPINYNQLIRWVMNKETHANALQEIVTQYFMTQRIKFDTKDYAKKLAVLHKMLIYADLSHIGTLRSLLKEFQELYFSHSH
jgi:nickel superoxide dismutase